MPTPLESMGLVAAELQPIGLPFAFVGGCAIWLLVDNPGLTDFRSTQDVDLIIEVVTLVEYIALDERLRAAGFRHDTSEGAPMFRWIVKGCRVDVMPIDSKVIGMNSKWFREALETAKLVNLDDRLQAKVITGPMFLATKLAAFHDRGKMDFYGSKDLEDIVTLIDGCADIAQDVASSSPEVCGFIAENLRTIIGSSDFEDALLGHLSATFGARERAPKVKEKFAAIVALIVANGDPARSLDFRQQSEGMMPLKSTAP